MMYQLAPLESVSCYAFRAMCSFLGADRTYTEMLRAKSLARHNKSTWDMIDTFGDENCFVQLLANKESEIDKFFSVLDQELKEKPHLENIKGYNLNLGCPSPDVVNFGGGAALIKRTTKVCKIITAISENTSLNVNIKMRLGLNKYELDNKTYLNLLEALNSLELKNFNEIIIHLKHAKERSDESFHYEVIPELVKVWKRDLTLNGGYSDKFLPKEKVFGVMFGKSAIIDPLMFARLKNDTKTKKEALDIFNKYYSKHKPHDKYMNYLKKYSGLFLN